MLPPAPAARQAEGFSAASGPDFSIALTHTSSFLQGQTNAVYLIRVVNEGSAASSGTISVVESMPSGLTITSMWGPGWTCAANTCTRSDTWPAGQMLPTISVLATVAPNAPPSISNMATVSGGGDSNIANNIANDVSTIAAEGYAVTWGDPHGINGFVPTSINDLVSISAGDHHVVGLRKNGTVVQWGSSMQSPAAAQNLTGVIAVAAGGNQSFALKSDGTVVAWAVGDIPQIPPGNLADVVAISSGFTGCIAVKSDGTVMQWGTISWGSQDPNTVSGVVSVSGSQYTVAALRWDGSVMTWGPYAPAVPSGLGTLSQVVGVSTMAAVGLRTDGTVIAWKDPMGVDLTNVPSGLNHVVSISAKQYALAIKDDGTVAAWGDNSFGKVDSASRLTSVRAASAGSAFGVAIVSVKPIALTIQTRTPDLLPDSPYFSVRPDLLLDGQPVYQPTTILVPPGSSHEISTTATQTNPAGIYMRFQFLDWSDGGAITHTVTPVADTTYTAKFRTQFQLTLSAGAGGTISPATDYYDAGSAVQLLATPQGGYVFTNFSTSGYSFGSNPFRLSVKAPMAWQANFVQPSGALLRAKLTRSGGVLQGQTNAVYIARIWNAGTGPLTGVSVAFGGGVVASATGFGAGWTCNAGSCSRSDTLAAGQEYPALLFVGSVPANVRGATNPSVSATSGNLSALATVLSTAYDNGNSVIGWGDNTKGQTSIPQGLSNVVSVSGGLSHSLALKGDGTVRAWGDNALLQAQVPLGLTQVIAIAAGSNHNLALTSNGTVVAWGDNSSGQATVPGTATQVIAIAAGANHSLALTSDGKVLAWGANGSGQTTVPAAVTRAVAIAAGGDHSLAVLSDGTVIAWGSNTYSESTVPGGLAGVEEVAAGVHFSLARKVDGQIVVWGTNPATIQSALPGGLTDTYLMAAGANHVLAQQWNGGLFAWGSNSGGQSTVPQGLSGVTGVGAGGGHSLAITSGQVRVQYTFSTQPQGIPFYVDGVQSTSSATVQWVYGSAHTVSIPAAQAGPGSGSMAIFTGWSDQQAMLSRTFFADEVRDFVLNFKMQYLVTTSASTGGTITPPTGYFDSGTQINVQAATNQGYLFAGFSGGLTGTTNPRVVTVTAPITIAASFTAIPPKPKLRIALRHTNALLKGQTNAVYRIRAGNDPLGGPTSGQVKVTLTVPTGLQVIALSGPGWTCAAGSCTRSDGLAGGKWYPAITAVATVAANAPASVSMQAAASGGGDTATPTATDTAPVNAGATPVMWINALSNLHRNDRPYPAGLTNIVAVAAGADHFLALRKDGTVAAWGSNQMQQCDVPNGLSGVIAISAGGSYSAALKSNGTVVVWGTGLTGTAMPATLADVVQIAAGTSFLMALKADGTLAAWGVTTNLDMNAVGQATDLVDLSASIGALGLNGDGVPINLSSFSSAAVPQGIPPSVAIAEGGGLSAAIAADGSIRFWGTDANGSVPANWSGIASAAFGPFCSVGIGTDQTVRQHGCANLGSSPAPKDVTNALAADVDYSLAVILTATPPPVTVQVSSQAGALVVDGTTYQQAQTFQWSFGSSHTVSASATVDTGTGQRSLFASWSDGGAMAHTFTVASAEVIQLTANFDAQVYLTTSATAGGSISPASGWYAQGANVQLTATPASGYTFTGFSGTYSATFTPFYVTMSVPATMTANFAVISPQPTAVGVSPFTGSGSEVMFTPIYKAGYGYKDLLWVQFLVAAAPDGGGQPFCFLHYDVQGDAFWLYGDGGFFVGPVKPGTASGQLQNTLCGLNTQMSSASGNGDTFGMGLKVVFKSAASLKLYLRAYTQGQLDTGWVERGTWTTAAVPLGNKLMIPSSGSGGQQTFTARFWDPAGYDGTNLGWAQFLVAAAPDGGGQPFCFVHYDRAGNGLWMYSGDVGFFLGPVSPGTASNALSSSACSIDPAGASAVSQYGVLSVTVPVVMKAPMSGAKNLYQRMMDPLLRDSNWVNAGTWTVP
ncbi:MAG: hypothetical protein J0H49_12570 [Acidobacteria bacterium]|nr:hypothetical protein [Acidobacteriota bacterium]